MNDWRTNYSNKGEDSGDKMKFHRFSFMHGDPKNPESSQFMKFKSCFLELCKEPNSQRKADKLLKCCKDFCEGDKDKIYLHRMFLVLLSYYEVFNRDLKLRDDCFSFWFVCSP